MKRILILFAHPKFEQSRANRMLVNKIQGDSTLTFHDLYERYPHFHIDVNFEKELLLEHDVVIWHHPLYWYSCPPLMKQWIDMVLEYGWAYGPGGDALQSKKCLQVITTGGTKKVYCSEGKNVYSVNQFLRPFEQTARLCGMQYLPPYAVMGTHSLSEIELESHADQYLQIIDCLKNGQPVANLSECVFQDDIPQFNSNTLS
ncbi:NAD(P)H oxidoreductase [Neolewinella aurantiaca]|uniref:NAD(P)H oxidoreductase n=1 Tax=Neolewinella aurantiaca TaxID=2602767 RepID=A0A5C7FHZ1_9BACT|nr:NAD(P)H-dependent oxidoreductase [Neolewinella aurantiaca]TXF90755.1 NAD(P)H oxidoreductase [Neolewinella aurantiaca]